VAGSEQHAGYRQSARDGLRAKLVEALTNDGSSEFQITVFDRMVREPLAQSFSKSRKLRNGTLVAAAVTAKHDPEFFRHRSILKPHWRAGGDEETEADKPPWRASGLGPRSGSTSLEMSFSSLKRNAADAGP
jgi:hypothetical protein